MFIVRGVGLLGMRDSRFTSTEEEGIYKLHPLPAFMFMRFQEMGMAPSKTLVSATASLDCQILLGEFEFPSFTALSCLKGQCKK